MNILNEPSFFVVGCGRSGTTLLRRLLNEKANVAIPPESLFIVDYLSISKGWKAYVALQLLGREAELSEWGLSTKAIAESLALPNLVDVIKALHKNYAIANGADCSGQKTPRLVRYGDRLTKNFPHAKYVELIRDPRAVVSSLKKSNVHNSNALFGALRWRKDVLAGKKLKKTAGQSHQYLRYEALISEPVHQVNSLIDFLGLKQNENGEGISDSNLYTNSYYSSVHKLVDAPVDQSRAESWRTNLTIKDIALIERICGDLMREHGYEPQSQASWWNWVYAVFLAFEGPYILTRQIYHSLRHRPNFLPIFLLRKISFLLLVNK
jgi:hypothetical protein